jgi:outer membrane protein
MNGRLVFAMILSVVSSATAEVVTWDGSVAEAAKNNAELRSYQESLKAAEYQSKAAFGAFLPQVSGNLGYGRGNSGGSTENSYSATLGGSQNLFSGFLDRARLDQAVANEELASATLDAAKARVSFDLKSAYAALSYAQGFVKLSDDIVRRRNANLELVELRFQGGRENKGSYFLSKAALSQARSDNLQARDSVDVGRTSLARMLGRDETDELQLVGTVPTSEPAPSPDFERLLPQTPDHRQAVAQQKISETALTIARSQFYPSLDLTGSIGRQGNEWFPDNSRWNVGLTLTLPLFNGGRDYFTSRSASASLAAVFASRQGTDRQIRTKLKQAFASYVQAIERLNVDTEFLEAASVRAEIARNKYNNGLLSFEDWDIIENDLIARQKTALASQRDRITAEAAWEQVQGKGVIP